MQVSKVNFYNWKANGKARYQGFTAGTCEPEIITVVLFIMLSSVLLPSHKTQFKLNSEALFACCCVSSDRLTLFTFSRSWKRQRSPLPVDSLLVGRLKNKMWATRLLKCLQVKMFRLKLLSLYYRPKVCKKQEAWLLWHRWKGVCFLLSSECWHTSSTGASVCQHIKHMQSSTFIEPQP